MPIDPKTPLSQDRREEIERECVQGDVEFCGCCNAVALVYSHERGCGVCLTHKWPQDDGSIEFPHEAFPASPARIAAYVDKEIAAAVDFRDSGEALKMQARALEVVHKVQVREAVRAALEEAFKLERWSLRAVDCGDGDDHHYDGLETDPTGEWINLDSIRAILAERVGP